MFTALGERAFALFCCFTGLRLGDGGAGTQKPWDKRKRVGVCNLAVEGRFRAISADRGSYKTGFAGLEVDHI